MGILDHSEEDEVEERSHCGGGGARFGARRQKPRAKSHQQLLLMDSVKAGADGEGAGEEEEEMVPLPEYERLSQSARLPDDDDDDDDPASGAKDPAPPAERSASLTPPPRQRQQKPAAWRLLQYVRSMHRSSAGAVVAGGYCGGSSDGDSKSSDGEKEVGDDGDEEGRKDKDKQRKKKRSSWLPDPDRRWPVQGFY